MDENFYTQEEVQKIWSEACEIIKTQITPATFSTWIASNPLISLEKKDLNAVVATISCSTGFHATNIKKNLYWNIKNSIEQIMSGSVELVFVVGTPIVNKGIKTNMEPISQIMGGNYLGQNSNTTNFSHPKPRLSSPPLSEESLSPTVEELFSAHNLQASFEDRSISSAKRIGLRLDYKFKTFAVSTSNEMAHAAAIAVSKSPGTAYNPLFFYGGVGVGKTHLMHAIGHNILQSNPEANIIYSTGEEFTNEIVEAIQNKKAFTFKKRYRNATVLLIDDIQFIAGKTAVQEEFFHTFNALIKQNSQIVLTSDRPPHEINLIEDRLRSRFEAGLMIDIQQPSFELRTAILLIKAEASNISLPMNLAQMIASKVDSARKIEGVISKIKSEVELKNQQISPELIDLILKNEDQNQRKKIIKVNPEEVIKTVANHYRVKQSAIKGRRRTKDLTLSRHVAMFLLREELSLSLEEVGKWFSGRDHTSVMHASKKIESLLETDESLRQDVSALKMSLSAISK